MPQPSDGPVIEFEALIKVFFAEHGTKADLQAAISAAEDWVARRYADGAGINRAYLEGSGPFPERLPWLILCGRFLDELTVAVERWSTWARATVEGWPDDVTRAEPDLDTLRAMSDRYDRR